jgi:predicted NAD/FAD-dependent oxidoreductase
LIYIITMENVKKVDPIDKKKAEDKAQRIRCRWTRLTYAGLNAATFAKKHGWNYDTVYAALTERRLSDLSNEILRAVDTLPLPGEGSQANKVK